MKTNAALALAVLLIGGPARAAFRESGAPPVPLIELGGLLSASLSAPSVPGAAPSLETAAAPLEVQKLSAILQRAQAPEARALSQPDATAAEQPPALAPALPALLDSVRETLKDLSLEQLQSMPISDLNQVAARIMDRVTLTRTAEPAAGLVPVENDNAGGPPLKYVFSILSRPTLPKKNAQGTPTDPQSVRAMIRFHNLQQLRKYPPTAEEAEYFLPSVNISAREKDKLGQSRDVPALRAMSAVVRALLEKGDYALLGELIKEVDDDRVQRMALKSVAAEPTPERAAFLVRLIGESDAGNGIVLPIIVHEVLRDKAWRKHPEIAQAMVRRSVEIYNTKDGLANSLAGKHMLEILADYVLPLWAEKHPELVAPILETRGADAQIAHYVLTKPFARRHPEWAEAIVTREKPADEIDWGFLGEDFWNPKWVEYWETLRGLSPQARAEYLAHEPPPYRRARAPERKFPALASADRVVDLGAAGRFQKLAELSRTADGAVFDVRRLPGQKRFFLKQLPKDRHQDYLIGSLLLQQWGFPGKASPVAGADYVLVDWVPGTALEKEIADPRFWDDPMRYKRLALLIESLATGGFAVEGLRLLHSDGVWRIVDFSVFHRKVEPAAALAGYQVQLRRASVHAADKARFERLIDGLRLLP